MSAKASRSFTVSQMTFLGTGPGELQAAQDREERDVGEERASMGQELTTPAWEAAGEHDQALVGHVHREKALVP